MNKMLKVKKSNPSSRVSSFTLLIPFLFCVLISTLEPVVLPCFAQPVGTLDSKKNDLFSHKVLKVLGNQLNQNYGGAAIEFLGSISWKNNSMEPSEDFSFVQILGDNGRGEINFSVQGIEGHPGVLGSVRFRASLPARIAVKRIHPSETLKETDFITRNINVESGAAREYRGVLLSPQFEISNLEASQTIMEGQFLTSNAIRNTPDIRRGDAIRIHLVSEGMLLSVPGVAQEQGFLHKQLRVLTSKSKRELLGSLKGEGIVEVKL